MSEKPIIGIFISAAEEDLVHARALRDALQQLGFDVFLFTETTPLGTEWRSHIESKISSSRIFVPFRSVHFERSKWCRYETDLALVLHTRNQMQIIPVLLGSTDSLPFSFLNSFNGREWATITPQGLAEEIRVAFASDGVVSFPKAAILNLDSREPLFFDYEEVGLIGTGGFADVYSGIRSSKHRIEALKVLRSALRGIPEYVRRFIRGAERQAALRHPNIVEVYDINSDRAWYSMEYMDRGDLSRVTITAPLRLDELVGIFQQLCDAVAFAHENGILHRDIKPGNVLLNSNGEVKLVDFDLVYFEGMTALTRPGAILGSMPFLAPEVALAGQPYSKQSDIFAMGVVLFYFLTGSTPIMATLDSQDIGRALRNVGRERFAPVVISAVDKKPGRRPISVTELKNAFTQLLPVSTQRASLPLFLDGPERDQAAQFEISSEIINALSDRTLWSGLPDVEQDRLIRELALALGSQLAHVETRTWRCKDLKFRIAAFRCKTTGVVLHLLPGGNTVIGTENVDSEYEFCKKHYQDWQRQWNQREIPMRVLYVPPFFMGRYPVTQAEWDRMKEECGLRDKRTFIGEDLPIDRVSWDDIQPFLAASALRLPSEVEWEYACRAGSSTRFFWGIEFEEEYCWYHDNSGKTTQSVVRHLNKANAFGLVDMLGNIWEWCADTWHETYGGASDSHEPRLDGISRHNAQRGGGWNNHPSGCRCAFRSHWAREDRLDNTGFRVAKSLVLT